MDTRNNFPEFSDEWVFVPEKNTSLRNQIIFNWNGIKLLNVRKVFTNDVYFGAIFTAINDEGVISHNFRCKDRGFTEELVDNREAFISLFKEQLAQHTDKTIDSSNYTTIKPNFLQEYHVAFIIDDDGNYFATTANINNTALTRGIYGSATQQEYERKTKNYGFSVLNRLPTEEEVKTHIIDKQINALSANFCTRINTAYSNIKIYHKSEVQNGT